MTFKTLEIRDSGTLISAMAISMLAENDAQAYYVHDRCGHPNDGTSIVLMRLDDMLATNDPYEWPSRVGSTRTMPVAHQFIIENFTRLRDGDVVDVEFILGERSTPKRSER